MSTNDSSERRRARFGRHRAVAHWVGALSVVAPVFLSLACRAEKLPVVLGYDGDTPMAFVDIQSGTAIEIHGIEYKTQGEERALSRYRERIILPSGRTIALDFDEIGDTPFSLIIDGKRRNGPSAEQFKKMSPKGLMGFAPSFRANALFSLFFSPTSEGAYNQERTDLFQDGSPYLASVKRTYADRVFTFAYSDWKWSAEPNESPVEGFRVTLTVEPAEAEEEEAVTGEEP